MLDELAAVSGEALASTLPMMCGVARREKISRETMVKMDDGAVRSMWYISPP